jgi:hypothetical protein
MDKSSNAFRTSLLGQSSLARVVAVSGLLVVLWLAILWAVSLP